MARRLRRLRDDESGMFLVFAGLGFMGFLICATLAIDVGQFMVARSQAQNAAEGQEDAVVARGALRDGCHDSASCGWHPVGLDLSSS